MRDFRRINPTNKQLGYAIDNSAVTMMGYMPEELHLYIDAIKDFLEDGVPVVMEYTGKQLNEVAGTNLPNGLNMFSIGLGFMKDISKFAVTIRFEYGFRWLDDIVSNHKQEVTQ